MVIQQPSADDRKAAIPFIINYELLRHANLREAFSADLSTSSPMTNMGNMARGTWEVVLCRCELHLTASPATMTDIRVILSLSESTIRRSVRTLEKLEVLKRHTDKNDQRRQLIVLVNSYQAILDLYVDECSTNFRVLIDHNDKRERDEAVAALRKTEGSLLDSETRYREIYEQAPIPMWIEDWSGVKNIVNKLTAGKIEDWRAHLAEHPDLVIELYNKSETLETSNATLEFYGAVNAAEYPASDYGA